MRTLVCVLLACFAFSVSAEELNYNVVNINASAKTELANDLMEVTLSSYHQEEKAERASSQVNRDMAWAIDLLKRAQNIKYQTRGYNTHPNYNRSNRITSWTSSQRVVIESDDFAAMGNLLVKLQERLKVETLRFTTKDETRDAEQDELTSRALAAFKKKAALVQKAMDAKDYRVVNMSINQQGHHNPPFLHARAEMKSMTMDSAAPHVAMEAGESTLSTQVHGSIQLVY
ncbi:SIMPL domain-containing protein [uncultured Pseudoteredinibacter sp.]|uniref:SIMPL domain-containing protein n=1 Tax=uncultured Pseudoteredinibacter sp. TaxID=1641701 RepID=UPI00261CEE6A|nr:SIMPL domain-containing protein [uncultured Pseudoteredinibacter sp.]